MLNKLVFNIGINDADYTVGLKVKGKQVWCHFYRTWKNMLKRCYDRKTLTNQPTYIGCTVCDEWLTFSNFKAWMENQDWVGKQLDKDLLFTGNKIYSKNTCVFVNDVVNGFVTDCRASRGRYPIGVSLDKRWGKFRARVRNPFTEKQEWLGSFVCPNQAHQVWRKRKYEYACQLADLQEDPRVAKALMDRYAPDKDWTNR